VLLDPLMVGATHCRIAESVRRTLARLYELQDIIALLGVEELGTEADSPWPGQDGCSASSANLSW
jgi:F0F1-type ATP synthase beta subunit